MFIFFVTRSKYRFNLIFEGFYFSYSSSWPQGPARSGTKDPPNHLASCRAAWTALTTSLPMSLCIARMFSM